MVNLRSVFWLRIKDPVLVPKQILYHLFLKQNNPRLHRQPAFSPETVQEVYDTKVITSQNQQS